MEICKVKRNLQLFLELKVRMNFREVFMDNSTGPDTIFYTLKLKRTKTQIEVFEKMKKSIKKKGATKKWNCVIDNDCMIIDFGDEISENFCISFDEKKICNSFCKVYFPISGENYDDEKKSEFKALLNMIWSARTMFSQMEITDDYGLATEFMESKKYKLSLRELTDEECTRVRELYDSGITNYPDMIMAIILRDLNMSETENWYDHINVCIPYASEHLKETWSCMWGFWETYIYETATYQDIRVMEHPSYGMEFSGCWFSVAAFTFSVDELYHYRDLDHNSSFGVKHAQIRRFYQDKVYPQLDIMSDGFEKCCFAYRFFLSVYEFCGFKFVGRKENSANYRYIIVE